MRDVYRSRIIHLVYRSIRPWLFNDIIFGLTRIGRKQKSLLDQLHSFTCKVINKRKEDFFNCVKGRFSGLVVRALAFSGPTPALLVQLHYLFPRPSRTSRCQVAQTLKIYIAISFQENIAFGSFLPDLFVDHFLLRKVRFPRIGFRPAVSFIFLSRGNTPISAPFFALGPSIFQSFDDVMQADMGLIHFIPVFSYPVDFYFPRLHFPTTYSKYTLNRSVDVLYFRFLMQLISS